MHYFGRFGYGMAHGASWMGWVAPIAMAVFWALIITALVFFIRYLFRQSRLARRDDSALEILKIRYAKGEISREEFEQRRKDLA